MVVSGLCHFSPGSIWPCVISALCTGRLIKIVRYIIYNRVMALDSCQNFVNVYLDINVLTIVFILILMTTYAMLNQA